MNKLKKYNIYTYTIFLINGNFYDFFFSIIDILSIIIGILLSVAFYTLAERKFMGSIQRRLGPNVVGFFGILQAIADALKLIFKEIVIPYKSNKILFVIAPIFFLTLSLTSWSVIPLTSDVYIADIMYSILFIYLISSLSVFGIIIAGWASNSKYPFLGSLRSAAQMISYEVSMGFILIIIITLTGSFNIIDIIIFQKDLWLIFIIFPLFLIFLVTILAETNRAPFDLPEAEAELVAGYNLEYSGILFVMFFLAEYLNMILMSFLTIHLFLGGWYKIPLNLEYINIFYNYILFHIYIYIDKIIFYFKLYFFIFDINYINFFHYYFKYKASLYFAHKYLNIFKTYFYIDAINSQIIFILLFLRRFFVEYLILEYDTEFLRYFSYKLWPFEYHFKIIKLSYLKLYNIIFFKFNFIYENIDNSFIYLIVKFIFFSIFFILTRASLPRYRYDQLMFIGWKSFLPFTLGYLFFIIGICFCFDIFPNVNTFPFF